MCTIYFQAILVYLKPPNGISKAKLKINGDRASPCLHNTYIRTYIHAYILTYIHTHTYTHTYTYIHIYTNLHIHIHTHIHIYTYTHTYIHTYINIYIHAYIHTYIQKHTHTVYTSSTKNRPYKCPSSIHEHQERYEKKLSSLPVNILLWHVRVTIVAIHT